MKVIKGQQLSILLRIQHIDMAEASDAQLIDVVRQCNYILANITPNVLFGNVLQSQANANAVRESMRTAKHKAMLEVQVREDYFFFHVIAPNRRGYLQRLAKRLRTRLS